MDANSYQEAASRTLIMEPDTTFTNEELSIMLAALELGAAVGRVLEFCKKGICHRHGYSHIRMRELLDDLVSRAGYIANNDLAGIEIGSLSGTEQMLIWCALGLGGEAGEVMESISKIDTDGIEPGELTKELGDGAWYSAALATLMGVPLSEVLGGNISKLRKRFPDGWGSEASKARVDTL